MAPLIDVTFQLIVFFMLVMDMGEQQREPLTLPAASMATLSEGRETIINVLSDGRVRIGGRTVEDGPLEAFLELHAEEDWPLLIRADRSAPFESIQKIMTIASAKGRGTQLRFAAIQE